MLITSFTDLFASFVLFLELTLNSDGFAIVSARGAIQTFFFQSRDNIIHVHVLFRAVSGYCRNLRQGPVF